MQQLSCAAARDKAAAEASLGDGEGTTKVPPSVPPTVVDYAGERVRWREFMLDTLASGESEHPSVEVFTVQPGDESQPQALWGQLALRVRAGAAPLPKDTVVGFYTGWVGTETEFFTLKRGVCARDEEAIGLPPLLRWIPRAAVLARRYRLDEYWQSFTGRLTPPTGCSRWPKRRYTVSPHGRGGAFVGNSMCRINDGEYIPPPPPQPSSAQLAGRDEAAPLLEQPSGAVAAAVAATAMRQRAANVRFVTVEHDGWLHQAVIALATLRPGQELLLSYGDDYWSRHARNAAVVRLLERMSAGGGAGCCGLLGTAAAVLIAGVAWAAMSWSAWISARAEAAADAREASAVEAAASSDAHCRDALLPERYQWRDKFRVR